MPMVGHAGEHDPGRLGAALTEPAYAVGSGVTIGAEEPIAGLWLRLTVAEAGTGRIAADRRRSTRALSARDARALPGARRG